MGTGCSIAHAGVARSDQMVPESPTDSSEAERVSPSEASGVQSPVSTSKVGSTRVNYFQDMVPRIAYDSAFTLLGEVDAKLHGDRHALLQTKDAPYAGKFIRAYRNIYQLAGGREVLAELLRAKHVSCADCNGPDWYHCGCPTNDHLLEIATLYWHNEVLWVSQHTLRVFTTPWFDQGVAYYALIPPVTGIIWTTRQIESLEFPVSPTEIGSPKVMGAVRSLIDAIDSTKALINNCSGCGDRL
jgi:hypothetical protein